MGSTCSQDTTEKVDGSTSEFYLTFDLVKNKNSYYTVQEVLKTDVPALSKDMEMIRESLENKKEKGEPIKSLTIGNLSHPYKYTSLDNSGPSSEKVGYYTGTFNKNGQRCGTGTMVWDKPLSIYCGQWDKDKANGWGYLILDSKEHYYGMWKDDKAEGKGTYVHSDGSSYTGDWIMDKQQGIGTETWPDKSTFKGMYVDSRKNGYGEFNWADGTKYSGEVKDNKIEGKGTYSWQDGRVYEGVWVNNQMHGYGDFKWKDGKHYKGNFSQDKKHGHGTFTWPDQRSYDGNWSYGKQFGPGVFCLVVGGVRKAYPGTWAEDGTVVWKDGKGPQNNAKTRK